MSSITLGSNIASLQVQRRLAESTAGVKASFERLSSGLRINRASDDAAGLSLAKQLNVDARVYTQAARNVNDGISFLNVADGAVSRSRTSSCVCASFRPNPRTARSAIPSASRSTKRRGRFRPNTGGFSIRRASTGYVSSAAMTWRSKPVSGLRLRFSRSFRVA